MRERLDGGCIVILSNLGYSSSGEVLNCKYVLHLLIIALYNSELCDCMLRYDVLHYQLLIHCSAFKKKKEKEN